LDAVSGLVLVTFLFWRDTLKGDCHASHVRFFSRDPGTLSFQPVEVWMILHGGDKRRRDLPKALIVHGSSSHSDFIEYNLTRNVFEKGG
jgi:hypothetical protein